MLSASKGRDNGKYLQCIFSGNLFSIAERFNFGCSALHVKISPLCSFFGVHWRIDRVSLRSPESYIKKKQN